jgi:hypothetical protein
MEKVCISCKLTVPIFEFYRHPGMADGLQGKCKNCCRHAALKNRAENIERVRAYDRGRGMHQHRVEARRVYMQTEQGKTKHAEANARWQEMQPVRKAAIIILNNAVKNKRITKWPVCAIPECETETVEGHHPDYGQPLSVVWLCNKHHRACHDLLKNH